MATPYRNDQDALMARLVSLVDELDALRSRASALRDLERTEQDVEREIADVRRKVARIAPTRLPLLERVSIAAPCSADWETMIPNGDGRSRHCGQCDKSVYDVSAMGAEEAETFLRAAAGEACLRLYRRADGRVLTSDCSVGVRRRLRRRVVAGAVSSGLLAAGALLVFDRVRPPVTMGTTTQGIGEPVMPQRDPQSQGDQAVAPPEPTAYPHVTGGAPPRLTPQDRLDSEMAHLRALLDKRAATTDLQGRRALEADIRAGSQRILQLSPPAQPPKPR